MHGQQNIKKTNKLVKNFMLYRFSCGLL